VEEAEEIEEESIMPFELFSDGVDKDLSLKDFGVFIDYFEHPGRNTLKRFNFQCFTRLRDLRAFYHNIP
jgi:hypothetical protein